MTLLHIDGFESGDFLARGYVSTMTHTRSTTTRFGYGYSMTQTNGYWTKPITASQRVTFGWAQYIPVIGTQDLLTVCTDSGGSTQMSLGIGIDGSVAIKRGVNPVVATSANNLLGSAQWNYWEFTLYCHTTLGYASARLNGVEVVSFNGNTRNSGTTSPIDAARFIPIGTNQANLWDDMYVLNDQGSVHNAPLGDVRVQTLAVTGDGNVKTLAPFGSANNWENVDEFVPSMADYNWSATPGDKDSYAVADPLLGTTNIIGISSNSVALKNDAGTRQIINTVAAGGTNYPGTTRTLSTSAQTQTSIFPVNPNTGVAWTLADIVALEVGVEVV